MGCLNVSFAGAGRVAGALSGRMHMSGINVLQIVSRDESNGRKLAASCNATWTRELSFPGSSDIIIVAVPDHNLQAVLAGIKCEPDTIVAHTAGSLGLEVFPEQITRRGVFYPLQTFSANREIDFTGLPFFIEGSDESVRHDLKKLAEAIGGSVHFANTEQRKLLHLSAVFICNFTNHMLSAGMDIAAKAGYDPAVFRPLIKETIAKALDQGPQNSQTGPAVRNDLNIIEKHLDLLSFSPEFQSMYREITNSIIKYYNKSDK